MSTKIHARNLRFEHMTLIFRLNKSWFAVPRSHLQPAGLAVDLTPESSPHQPPFPALQRLALAAFSAGILHQPALPAGVVLPNCAFEKLT